MDRYTGWPVVIMGTTGFDVTKFLARLCEESNTGLALWLTQDNVSARGTLDRAKVSRALLQLRNTPDRDLHEIEYSLH